LPRLLQRLCRRLHAELLHTRVAQLRLAASAVRCTTVAECIYQAQLLGRAAEARCELAVLEVQR
jgi:hypothetical protein